MPLLKQRLNKSQIEELKSFIKNKERSRNEVCRAQAVLLLNNGNETKTIEMLTGYSRRQSFRLRASYVNSGIKKIEDKNKGRPKELLTQKQIKEIVKIVREKKPKEVNDRYGEEDFWTTGILGDFIKKTYAVKYKSKTSYYLIFREAKFTYHKPGRVYEKHSDEEIKTWTIENREKISKALNNPKTAVLAEDEMLLSTQTTFQKVWLSEGEYPKIEISNTRKNRSIYGFLDIKTGKEHAFKTERQNMFITAEILKKMRAIYPNKKLLIIWDNAGWHRGSQAQEFIKKDKNIQIIYFPRYAPELNPQEHVWKNGRTHVSHNRFIKNIDIATDEFVEFLNTNNFHYSSFSFGDIS